MRIASSSRRSLETGERRRVDCRLSRGVSPLSSQLEATLSTQETTSLFERDERRFIKATLLETGERRRVVSPLEEVLSPLSCVKRRRVINTGPLRTTVVV